MGPKSKIDKLTPIGRALVVDMAVAKKPKAEGAGWRYSFDEIAKALKEATEEKGITPSVLSRLRKKLKHRGAYEKEIAMRRKAMADAAVKELGLDNTGREYIDRMLLHALFYNAIDLRAVDPDKLLRAMGTFERNDLARKQIENREKTLILEAQKLELERDRLALTLDQERQKIENEKNKIKRELKKLEAAVKAKSEKLRRKAIAEFARVSGLEL